MKKDYNANKKPGHKRIVYSKRIIALIVGILVAFTTTYTLILPAITVDLETADEMNGLVLEESASEETAETAANVQADFEADLSEAGTYTNIETDTPDEADGEAVAGLENELSDEGLTVNVISDEESGENNTVGEMTSGAETAQDEPSENTTTEAETSEADQTGDETPTAEGTTTEAGDETTASEGETTETSDETTEAEGETTEAEDETTTGEGITLEGEGETTIGEGESTEAEDETTTGEDETTEAEDENTEGETTEAESTSAEEEQPVVSPLTYHCDYYDIEVSFDSSVQLPAGTKLEVRELYEENLPYYEDLEYEDLLIYQEYFKLTAEEMKKLQVEEFTTAVLYELSFVNEDGEEVLLPYIDYDINVKYQNVTVAHEDELIRTALYAYDDIQGKYRVDLFEKNNNLEQTPVITLDEYHLLKEIDLEKVSFNTYDTVLGLFAGKEIEEQEMVFEAVLDNISVNVTAPAGAFPEGTTMEVMPVEEQAVLDAVQSAVESEVKSVTAVDITFYDADGNEIQPEKEIQVSLRPNVIAVQEPEEPVLVHVDHEGEANIIEDVTHEEEEVVFESKDFSVYALVYTVDFTYEVNGQTYEFSLPGGGFVSFRALVEALNILENTDEDGNAIELQDTEAEEIIDAQSAEAMTDGLLYLDSQNYSEDARKFVDEVVEVDFSGPNLLWVGKVDAQTTVGDLKAANALDVQYSEELTTEQIDEINAQTVEAGDWALISVQPFISEEILTITMKNGDVFTICVTDAQLKKTVISDSGETWEITVTYGEDAGIPEGAELKVREILPEGEEYKEYYQQALEKAGTVNTADDTSQVSADEYLTANGYAHIFDIQIWVEDQTVEPQADVIVSMKLLDMSENEDTELMVIHFAEDGPEIMDLSEGADEKTAGGTELNFVTDEFSVYAVISDINSDNLNSKLNGKSYALVTGIAGDPGATTGYSEDWGQDYYTLIVNANAMIDTEGVKVVDADWAPDVSGLGAEGVCVWTDSTGSYVGGGATLWYFEQSGNGYLIYALDNNGSKKYVYNNGASVGLTSEQNNATVFTVTPNSDGTVLIHNGNLYLHNNTDPAYDWNEWVTRNYILTEHQSAPTGNEYKFRLCEYSEDFDSFAAQKVAASTITTNTNYIIYRKFENEDGSEDLYALAHDGTFVRVYDGGDSIYWRETDKNLYWNYQLDGSYPVLFTLDPETGDTIFINPSHSTEQTLSTTANGLTLLGKDNGEYSTAIECWDQAAYDYAGLHVTVSDDGTASLTTGTRVAGTSDEFLFAVASQMPGATAETVATVDSDSLGIKITMFDYGNATTEYEAGSKLEEMTAVAGSDAYTPHAAHALVKAYLENGLPSSTTNGAMTGLFTGTGSAVTAYKENVNHLFLQSYYDENGTFRYRSEDNYAYLAFDPESAAITGTDFTVYRQAATPYTSDISIGHTYYHHGHFMPFNDIDMNNNLSRLMNQYGNAYEDGTAVGTIPLEDGRTYEDIYGIQGVPNFYTGMKMETQFTQPRDGKLENGDDMVFKFTGDDDMWVYIDGILVLDIGGIHEPLSGTINFATGVVTNPEGSSLAGTTTLKQIFMNVRNAADTPQTVRDKIDSIVWNGDTFADYTNHSFSAFYMERGAGASNLDIQFNLKVTLTNEFTVEKELPEGVDERFANQTYKFRATYMDGTTELPLYAGITDVCTAVIYKDKTDDQGNPVPVNVDENGYFYLKAGEAAVFKMADESIRYNVKEVEIDSDLIEQVDMNGQQVTGTDGTAEAGFSMVEDRTQVLVTNHPKTQNLLITKHLTEDSAPLEENENPVFEFRVYLESTIVDEDGTTQQQLVPYSYAPYYLVKEVNGESHYFTLTGSNNTPVDKGTTPVVCSTTGRSGSINSIPPEYTIIIPDLVVGTNFYVEERLDNIPEGYEFVREELTEGTYDENTLGTTEEIIDHILPRDQDGDQDFDPSTIGRIKQGVDAESHVYNRKAAVIITVEKAWEPAPDEDVTVTVELHRYAKITNGTISVTLYDTNEAPIEGAVFELYKDGEATGTEVTTNVNGIAAVSGLESGTYKLVQRSTPESYSMEGHTTETGELTVVDNVTTPQILNAVLTNTALVTAGTVTLTVTDSGAGSGTAGAVIEGAEFTLYKDGAVYNSGYVTNSEGKIVVGNLAAGEYYFVQTGTIDAYSMPSVTRTEGFTVVEQPGVSQEFTQSMTNGLKGKGTVSLTLMKDSGEVVSGASFRLLTGSTVLEMAVTGADGTLSFTTELYEGSYTVHQVDTGSAGAEYAAAADQTVVIEANSVTTQQKSLTFVNEEAAGNVTVEVYTAVNGQTWGQNLLNTFSSLKAGTTYFIRFGVPENNIKNGDSTGITTSFVPGSAPSDITSISNSDWTSSGDPRYYVLAFTPQQDDTTYRIAVVSMAGWGFASASAVLVDNIGYQAALSGKKATTIYDVRSFYATASDTTNDNTRSVTHSNASPASAPSGYATDSAFVETYTLTASDNWMHTFDAQEKYDTDGNPYYYYIVETACSDPDYWIDSYTGDPLNETGTITVTNKKEVTGGLTITKTVTVNQEAVPEETPTIADGTYTFTITGPGNYSNTGTITITNGAAQSSIVLEDLQAGFYTISETGSTNPNGITLAQPQTVTVAAGSQASANVAAFTNNLVTTSLEIIKVVKGYKDGNHTLSGADFQLTRVDENGNTITGDGAYQSEVQTVDSVTGITTFAGLVPGRYKLEEIEAPAGYILVESPWYFSVDSNGSAALTVEYTMASSAENANSFYIENEPGVALPSTGGRGTRIFTILGGILLALTGAFAGLTLWRKRRRAE